MKYYDIKICYQIEEIYTKIVLPTSMNYTKKIYTNVQT